MRRIVLASTSPRRKELLKQCGVDDFEVIPSTFDEYLDEARDVKDIVSELALGKAREVAAANPDAWVIGGDTLVSYMGSQIGKPVSEDDALQTLKQLVGKTHQVHTAISLICKDESVEQTEVATADVTFLNVSDDKLREYIASGEPTDKAGSYAIQGEGAFLVDRIDGDPTTVVGLPVEMTTKLLQKYNIL